MYRLSNSFPYLLNRVGVRIGELFSERLEAYDVTLPMYRVLASLWERSDQRLGDLAEMTKIEISTLSRLVGTLKRKGLVSRRRLQGNARAVAINLTARGRSLTEELIPIAIHFADVAVRNRTPEEVEFIKRALAEAYECLNELEAEITTLKASAPMRRRRIIRRKGAEKAGDRRGDAP